MPKTIVIFSTKGGVGKTLIATNLAISLANDRAKKTCLLDLDLRAGGGDMARLLNIKPQRALADLIYALKKNPQETDKSTFVVKSPFGIDFMPGVIKPQQIPHLEPAKLKDALGLYQNDYDYFVIDAGSSFNETLISTLNLANLILLVTTPDILSIYQTKWILDTLQFLHFPLKMIKIVLNRAESSSSISWQEIRVSLACEILAKIPSEGKAAGLALNRSVPIIVDSPNSKISQSIRSLAERLLTDNDLYVEHAEIDQLRLKEVAVEEAPLDFWQRQGAAADGPIEEDIADEKDEILLLKYRINSRLIDEMNIKRLDLKVFSDPKKTRELRAKADILVGNLLAEEAGSFISSAEVRRKIVKEILDEALGLGPLEDLLADSATTDIMVNNKDQIYVERNGKIQPTNKKFISNEQVKTVIERIIAPIGRHIDESIPMVDARLRDGSRVNAIIPPLSLTGPTLTIRKFRKERFTIEDLIGLNTLNPAMAEFIKAAVASRKNIIVSGGTGSGKTTVLNVLSGFIPADERIVTIEDAAELKLHQEHWVRLESRAPNIEGKGAVSIRDLFRNTLRMRPDRIIIGECRGIETLDMLQAMNTGHDGSMTTIHANSTRDVLSRLDSMILMSGVELPIRAIREMIASAVDLIIHTARLSDGTRKILQVTEITGMRDELHVELQDIFVFKQAGIDTKGNVLGSFQATGYVPSFINEIKVKGIKLSEGIFIIS